jgi:Ycf4.
MMRTVWDAMSSDVLTYEVTGARRWSNLFFAVIVAIGGIGFLLAGLSSYFHVNLLPTGDASQLLFIPQGITMTFYGVAGILLDLYLWWIILLDVGSGYNEFNRAEGKIKIVRRGYPGKNRNLCFTYDMADVQAVRAEVKSGFNPKRSLYLRIKGKRDIPLNEVGAPMPLSELEARGADLAKFLGVPLEGL